MFFRDLMVGTDNRMLEKAPDVLNGVRVDITPYPFLSTMVDRLVSGITN
jgi:hypothetical protein